MTGHSNRTRYYNFMAGILSGQQKDPFCRSCKAYTNSVRAVREGMDEFERMYGEALGMEDHAVIADAAKTLSVLTTLPDAVGQKKAGNCRLPEGVCFVKSSKAMLDRIQGA